MGVSIYRIEICDYGSEDAAASLQPELMLSEGGFVNIG